MARTILPEPPDQLKTISKALCALINREIDESGPIPFSRFMEQALYAPGLGYYSAGLHKLGREGDFITSPELGELFAACIAQQLAELAEQIGPLDILEIGAGTGRLAHDLLSNMPGGTPIRRYSILERSADLRAVQREALQALPAQQSVSIEWLDQPPQEPWSGAVLANEVIDALAVERFRIRDGEIQQACVGRSAEGYRWVYQAAPPQLVEAVSALEMDLPNNYCSEILPELSQWLKAISATLEKGLLLFADYGYPRHEYYRHERRDGTVMCHYRHQAHDDVFFWPGLQDLTAWVDFTALAEAADQCHLDVEGYSSQAMFLLGCGLDEILPNKMAEHPETAADLSAEARQLTLPGMMGEKFQVMGLGRGLDTDQHGPLRGFSFQDLRYRL